MGSTLPEISADLFRRRLSPFLAGHRVDEEQVADLLYTHYQELRRWNPRLSLVGPGTASEVVERHYGEALAALPLIRESDRRLVDIGSGAGFPGFVLALARPWMEVTLVEPHQRKGAFLRSALRSLSRSSFSRTSRLSCQCLDARVEHPLPEGFPVQVDLWTCRALVLPPEALAACHERSPQARFLFWTGKELPLPSGFEACRELPLPGSDHRRIVEVVAV